MKTITVNQMRELDTRTINEAGIPGEQLMKIAGEGAAEEILEFVSRYHQNHVKRFVLIAGKGNNGGDAYVAARYLYKNTNIPILLYAVTPPDNLIGDAKIHAERLPQKVTITSCKNGQISFKKGDIIIDGLLGTGIKGPLKAPYDTLISEINNSELPVIALDIPSGLNGDDGSVETDAVKADMTVTMGLPKRGFLLESAPELCGIIKCIDIGIPQYLIDELSSDFNMTFHNDIKMLRRRPMNSFKNKNGHILVIGGSYNYPGAPLLTAKAAMRSGAGLVTLAVPESAKIATPDMHSIIFRRIKDDGDGTFSKKSVKELKGLADIADVVVIGPGMTTNKGTYDTLNAILSINKTIVIDADALNLLAKNIFIDETKTQKKDINHQPLLTLNKNQKGKRILTPHPGEFKRLTKALKIETEEDSDLYQKLNSVQKVADITNSIIVLKGNRTITAAANETPTINSSGSPALATAGSGDVLAGIIAAYSFQGENPFDTTASAVYIHGRCGEITKYGVRGTSADDLIDLIPSAMNSVSPFS
jgi:NAD(P)H-hydrate epimerase